jgi:hypothetical protein
VVLARTVCSVEGRPLRCAMGNFIRCRVTHFVYLDVIGNYFTCKGMVAVHRQLAVLDPGNTEHPGFALVVLELDFSTYVSEFMGHIFKVIGKGQFRLVLAKALFRAEFNADFIALGAAFERLFDFFDYLAVAAVNVIHGHIDALNYIVVFVSNGVGEGNELVSFNRISHGIEDNWLIVMFMSRHFRIQYSNRTLCGYSPAL